MEWSQEQKSWLVKVLHPERTVASLPGGFTFTPAGCATLLGLEVEEYTGELARALEGATEAARELLAQPGVAAMVDQLPLRKGARVVAFGDSHTADPQSWAVILHEVLKLRRPHDDITLVTSAMGGDTTTHGLVRMGDVVARDPDWILFFIGLNDARTQGPNARKTLVDARETASNLEELRHRAAQETKARRLWIAPAAVFEERVPRHWALSRFGVRFRNEDIASVGKAIHALHEPTVDLLALLGVTPPPELFIEDGLHLSVQGQQRVALEVLRTWSCLS